MAITRDNVLHVAKLARLELNEAEIDRMQRDLNGIIDYVNQLSELDTTDVPATTQVAVVAAPFRADAPISDAYRRAILGWLTGDGTGQGVEWHSRFRLVESTLPLFESKTMAIMNEQLLTNRLRAQGWDDVQGAS